MNLLVVESWHIVMLLVGLAAVLGAFLLLGNRKVRADHREERRATKVDRMQELVRSGDVPALVERLAERPGAARELHAALAGMPAERRAWRTAAATDESYQGLTDAVRLAAAAADLDNDLIHAQISGELAHFLQAAVPATADRAVLAA